MVFSTTTAVIESTLCYGAYSDVDDFENGDSILSNNLCLVTGFHSNDCGDDMHSMAASTTTTSAAPPASKRTNISSSTSPMLSRNAHHPHHHPSRPMCCLLDDDAGVDDDLTMARFQVLTSRQRTKNEILTYKTMAQLQPHLPLQKRGESFWLQYSLIQDGASIALFLQRLKECGDYSVLAIETVDGDVFGAFCASSWKVQNDWYGSGEGFLWRVKKQQDAELQSKSTTTTTTTTTCTHDDEQREAVETTMSSEQDHEDDDDEDSESSSSLLEVFKFAYQNSNIQQLHQDRLMIGGGTRDSEPKWGYGISLEQDLLKGSTSPCLTYESPQLSTSHSPNGCCIFEVRNLEVWTLTPCLSLQDAEKSQNRRRFLLNSFFKPRALSSRSNNNNKGSNNRRRTSQKR